MSKIEGGKSLELVLFVAGSGLNSRHAQENLRLICEEFLDCAIRVVDVFDDFEKALEHNILVTPALVASRCGAVVTLLGDLSDTEEVLRVLRNL